MGVGLVLFLIDHLLTNSQSALWLGEDGSGFIRAVNKIHALPYLQVIEVSILLIPFLIHGIFGIFYAKEARFNKLPYKENRAFKWQRISAYILVVAVLAHVISMRFISYPERVEGQFIVRVSDDRGLHTLAERLHVTLSEKEGVLFAAAPDFGTASLLVVRDTFKNPLLVVLYVLFVLISCYHAFNGLWTAAITWGITIPVETQRKWRVGTHVLMLVVSLLGIASATLTYYNLYG